MQTIRTNLSNNASSQYTNFDYVSMIEFNGVLLGAGPRGLHKICCGGDDVGVDIAAYFIPATSNFGSGKKRCRHVYADMDCSGSMQISLTGDGKTTIGPYEIEALLDEGPQRRRAKMGRGLEWGYGEFKVENVDGASFSVDNFTLLIDDKKTDRR